jgi:hypothetical protein
MTGTDELVSALLDAHVQHIVDGVSGPELDAQVRGHVDAIFAWFSEVSLATLVTREQVLDSVDRFVIELRVSGGITELAGEIARVVIAAKASEGMRLVDVLPTSSFEEFADKLQRFDRLREDVIRVTLGSQALSEAAARLLSQRVAETLTARLHKLPLVSLTRLAGRLEGELLPQLERRLRSLLFQRLERYRGTFAAELLSTLTTALDADFVRALADDLWAAVSVTPLPEVFSLLGEQDLEDLVVTVLEFWLRFRKSPYLRAVIAEGVGYFFEKYGAEAISDVIDDMGVTREMVVDELLTYLRPVVQHAASTGFLAERVRAQLTPFYESDACAKLLASR